MFNQGHQVGFSNYKDLVWVLYLDLDISCSSLSGIDVAKFIIKIAMNANPC